MDIGTVSTKGDRSTTRLAALDGVRAIAVLMVVALHVGYVVHPASRGLPKTYATGGFVGVDVFFVLSGFLITSLLLHEHDRQGGVSLRSFYVRRALRLLPALCVLLAVHLIYTLYTGTSLRGEMEALLSIFFYSSNLVQSFHGYIPSELTHTWSLAVEEQFYLLWPTIFVAGFVLRRSRSGDPSTRMMWGLVGALLLNDVARIIMWQHEGYPAAYMLPYCHADGLIIGCLLAFIHHRGYSPSGRAESLGWISLFLLVGFTFIWVQGPVGNSVYYGGFTVLCAAAAGLINGTLVEGRLRRFLSWRPLVATGRVSYGLYLWHVMVLTILTQHTLGLGRWPRGMLGLALSFLATFASWKLIEQPALRFKRRFEPAGQRLDVTPTGT